VGVLESSHGYGRDLSEEIPHSGGVLWNGLYIIPQFFKYLPYNARTKMLLIDYTKLALLAIIFSDIGTACQSYVIH
jgi:hypothetical protein